MRAVDTNPDGTTHTFVPSCVVSRQLSDTCNLTINSQRDSDTQAASRTKFSYASIITEPSCQGVNIAGKLNDGIRPTSSKENHDSVQGEITCHHMTMTTSKTKALIQERTYHQPMGKWPLLAKDVFLSQEHATSSQEHNKISCELG